jgi:hypothetical protein
LVDVAILVMGGLLILCIDPTALAAIADSETPWLTFAALLLLSTLAVGGRYAARQMRR